ncbi:ATP-binding cassette domain-containing protein [Streptomyces sp. NBC_01077]|uniref:ABC transporter ATP-binding protein n=1 Tax=Streptomyces sp. NBC_01077 TaxID=2903746 RepID=UPI0038639A4D|nr:ATP-binding cassette domain-containing protein [Streptomyces sp. NBC_01077]WSV43678.1 ATP-binding cassette domain-containing protein [Streptomyces sp. NBC_01077]
MLSADRPLFETHGLGVEYVARTASGTVTGLADIDIQWNKGEILGLLGGSGSGKTTLGRTLVGLQQPTTGDVTYQGQPLSRALAARSFRRDVQMIFQDPYQSLNPRRTVGQQVTEGLDIHRIGTPGLERTALAVAALEQSGLTPADRYWHCHPHQLSGGQRQRVVIAAALALGPQALVCDEPVSALDVSVRSQVLQVLKQLRSDHGIGLLFITHDVGLAWALCDRLAVLHQGQLVECGATEAVLKDPQASYTRALLAAMPRPLRHG